MNPLYILNEHGNPVPEPDTLKWAKWFEKSNRVVGYELIGESRVSAVFLGIDHGGFCCSTGEYRPILWETMIFGGPLDQDQDRCSGNQEQAMAMHQEMVKRVHASHERQST